jgi:hypothetical protein
VADARPTKRLSDDAYDALVEALAVFYWYRADFETFVRDALTDAPEILARLDFKQSKRVVSVDITRQLRAKEPRYQDLTIDLLMRLSKFDEHFTKLSRLEDGGLKVVAAQAALADVRRVVERHSELAEARERLRAEMRSEAETASLRRTHESLLEKLRLSFIELRGLEDAHERGRKLEKLVNGVFELFELEPRAAYDLEHEQIDGAFTFDTDDYLLEVKWWAEALQPAQLHILKGKIETKAKHVFGLFLAINGFTTGAIEAYSHGTPLILMDGMDLYAVLEGRISLREVLQRKRRFAAETGVPMLPVSTMLE